MKIFNRIGISLLLILLLVFCSAEGALAVIPQDPLSEALNDTAQYVYTTVANPQIGSTSGEWAVMGLARSGYAVPDTYYQTYYRNLEIALKQCGGRLHDRKYTEYSRVIVALSAIGKDARNVAGYDLTKPLGDYDKTVWQGLNGSIWALIALDTRDYPMPQNPEAKTQATRDMYIKTILDAQLDDGGWALNQKAAVSDPDITGMALQALAKYQDQPQVAKAIAAGLDCMSKQQDNNAGFAYGGAQSVECCVQMIVALNELGIPLDDSRFVKNGKTLADNLMTFYKAGKGFLHTADAAGDSQMATEQGLYALASLRRAYNKQNSLYHMNDAKALAADEEVIGGADEKTGIIVGDKKADVKKTEISQPGKTFPDIAFHANKQAIEALAARAVIDGDNGKFLPDNGMTRAEFATIVVRALGLAPKASNAFSDVAADFWYAPFIGTASTYGIINGVGGGKFDPNGSITRQEAAAMVARAAVLCGMENKLDDAAVRDVLAGFGDSVKLADYAQAPMAFCLERSLLDKVVGDTDVAIKPTGKILRAEVAQMLYNLLAGAKLL